MSVSRRGDALRGDARAPPAQARARVLPHRRPGSVQGDSELPEDDGEDGWADVSKNIKYTGKVMVAVNHEYVDMSHLLTENDEIAFFPPVTGG